MDRPRGFGGAVAADAAGKGELLEERTHPFYILALVRINLRIGTLQIDRRQHTRRAMAGASQEDRVEVVLVDQAIEMNVDEAQPRTRSPVAQQAKLDMLLL